MIANLDDTLTPLTGKSVVLTYPDGDAMEFDTVEDAKAFLAVNRLLKVPGSIGAKICHLRDGQWIEVK